MHKNRNIQLLILHCSGTREDRPYTGADIDSDHRLRGYQMAGYHYYVRRDGTVESLRPEYMVGAHCRGYNAHSLGICYEGGLSRIGQPADTRTAAQRAALYRLLQHLVSRYPNVRIVGHRDLSPDLNGDGVISPHEWLKECPCFDAQREYSALSPIAL